MIWLERLRGGQIRCRIVTTSPVQPTSAADEIASAMMKVVLRSPMGNMEETLGSDRLQPFLRTLTDSADCRYSFLFVRRGQTKCIYLSYI